MSDEQPHDVRTATETPGVSGDQTHGTQSAVTPPAEAAPAHRKIAVLLAVAAIAYVLDVVSKIIVVRRLADRDPVRVIDGVLKLNMIRNPGAAFSIGVGMTIVFSAVAVVVIVIILRVSRQLYSVPWAIALGLLLGGALGNLTDRIFRAPGVGRGYVVDFIQLPHWPVFNLADSSIVVGGCLMVLLSLRGLHPDGSHATE